MTSQIEINIHQENEILRKNVEALQHQFDLKKAELNNLVAENQKLHANATHFLRMRSAGLLNKPADELLDIFANKIMNQRVPVSDLFSGLVE